MDESRAKAEEIIPMQHLGQPRDIGEACYYVATTGHYCNGTTIRVDGGNASMG
jgi:NAD(P)-dependent dehydrogenase (short-subunit alcohol dehydrogenase family)